MRLLSPTIEFISNEAFPLVESIRAFAAAPSISKSVLGVEVPIPTLPLPTIKSPEGLKRPTSVELVEKIKAALA